MTALTALPTHPTLPRNRLLNINTNVVIVFWQVFGKLISGEADSESVKNETPGLQSEQSVPDSGANGAANDLREHMVGILFSQSGKLSHLQKQVCHRRDSRVFGV
jgi:hypothetical protein